MDEIQERILKSSIESLFQVCENFEDLSHQGCFSKRVLRAICRFQSSVIRFLKIVLRYAE